LRRGIAMQGKSEEKKKKCMSCGREIESNWQYCPLCTNKNEGIKCKFCDNEIEKDWNYCPNCMRKIIKTDIQTVSSDGNDWLREILIK
jgi:predicted amidophosphoribosyltransferase